MRVRRWLYVCWLLVGNGFHASPRFIAPVLDDPVYSRTTSGRHIETQMAPVTALSSHLWVLGLWPNWESVVFLKCRECAATAGSAFTLPCIVRDELNDVHRHLIALRTRGWKVGHVCLLNLFYSRNMQPFFCFDGIVEFEQKGCLSDEHLGHRDKTSRCRPRRAGAPRRWERKRRNPQSRGSTAIDPLLPGNLGFLRAPTKA